MNKILRYSFVALMAMIGMGNAFAEDVVFDFTTYGFGNAEDVTTRDFRSDGDKIVINFENGTNEKNGPKYYNTGTAIRCYGGNKIAVKLNLETQVVTKAEFTFASGEGTNEMTVKGSTDEGSFDGTTWTGRESGGLTAEIGGTSGHRRIQKIVFTLTPKDAEIYTVTGTLPLVNKSWDPSDAAAEMATSDGVAYTYVKEGITLEKGATYEFKVVKGHAWGEEYPSSNYKVTVDETATYTATITFNATTKEVGCETVKTGAAAEVSHTYSVIGTLVGNWDVDTEMTKGSDGLFRAVFDNVAKGKYEFKVRADKAWDIAYPSSNYQLEIMDDDVTVTITFDEKEKEIQTKIDKTISVANALEIINGLDNGTKTDDEYRVKGYVVGTPDFQRNTSGALYGNVNFEMADQRNGTTTLTVFRAKNFGNESFTEETINGLKDGDEVILKGKLQKYVKGEEIIPELVSGWLVSVNGVDTGITSVKAAAQQQGAVYNLKGQQVTESYKGLVIKNGKKYFNK